MNLNDNIVALATPEGRSAIAVFRLSGRDTFSLLKGVLPLSDIEPNRIKRFLLKDSRGILIDEIMFTKYVSPHSYTGEDMVEIFSHGGVATTKRILNFLSSLGFRVAEGGEFTFRALINGKISLIKAEAIDAICRAENTGIIDSYMSGFQGESFERFDRLYRDFLNIMSELIVDVEFVEEDLYDIKNILSPLRGFLKEIEDLINGYESVRYYAEGVDVVIAGNSNVGKSSLFNRLIGEERSIVTEIAGTTRDVVDRRGFLGSIPVRFVDTAGLRRTDDVIELIGQRKTREEIERAFLLLYMIDVERGMSEDDKEVFNKNRERSILVVNKIDINPEFRIDQYENVYYISARYNRGIEELLSGIKEFISERIDTSARSIIFTERQYDHFVNIRNGINRAIDVIENNGVADMVLFELNLTKREFESLLGKNLEEDIYNNIFSRFCVGK